MWCRLFDSVCEWESECEKEEESLSRSAHILFSGTYKCLHTTVCRSRFFQTRAGPRLSGAPENNLIWPPPNPHNQNLQHQHSISSQYQTNKHYIMVANRSNLKRINNEHSIVLNHGCLKGKWIQRILPAFNQREKQVLVLGHQQTFQELVAFVMRTTLVTSFSHLKIPSIARKNYGRLHCVALGFARLHCHPNATGPLTTVGGHKHFGWSLTSITPPSSWAVLSFRPARLLAGSHFSGCQSAKNWFQCRYQHPSRPAWKRSIHATHPIEHAQHACCCEWVQ